MTNNSTLIRAGWISVLGIILYNNWLLALSFNYPALIAGATTSEFGVAGQPHYLLFRWLDVAAGACFILGTSAVVNLADQKWLRLVLKALIIALGVSTIAEALLFPLTCASALSAQCAISESTHTVGWMHELHMVESIVSYIFISLLPIVAAKIAWHNPRLRTVRLASISLAVYMGIWVIESYYRILHQARSFGYEQRLFIILFSIWYITVLQATVRLSRRIKLNPADAQQDLTQVTD